MSESIIKIINNILNSLFKILNKLFASSNTADIKNKILLIFLVLSIFLIFNKLKILIYSWQNSITANRLEFTLKKTKIIYFNVSY